MERAAPVRRRFFDLHVSIKVQITEQVSKFFVAPYDIDPGAVDLVLKKRFEILSIGVMHV
ncbi:hypothetical protein M3A49_41305 [Paraburkholderia sp. CNPSo 3076]|uniref:hypothetical protein n=1 Tax=Paraburkholderia sp. CNPSo 3076 TaxID=2940936 RepID=UPI002250A501|nr:hypothetical protein [Paraburkholderia sp. CNPSo 3076]MCX5545771.1 hypothetical protein [Paraburkholderia sp. CNPSo 3076]